LNFLFRYFHDILFSLIESFGYKLSAGIAAVTPIFGNTTPLSSINFYPLGGSGVASFILLFFRFRPKAMEQQRREEVCNSIQHNRIEGEIASLRSQ